MALDPEDRDPAAERHRLRWRDGVIVLVVALVVRALYLWESSRTLNFDSLTLDTQYNLEWARAIATGVWEPPWDRLQGAPFFRAPLYSYALAGWFRFFGEDLLAVRIAQLVLGALSCVLTWVVGTQAVGRRTGLVAGLVAAVYWVLVYFEAEFLLPVALVFEALAGFALLFVAAERRSRGLALAAGLAFGLFAITRPNILVFFPVLVLWALGVARRERWGRGLLFPLLVALGCALPPAAVTLRNRAVSGEWVVVASQGGVNFYIGNHRGSNGWSAIVPGTRETWWGGFDDTHRIAEQAEERELGESEVSRFWFRRSFQEIAEAPGSWLALTGRKALLFLGDAEVPSNEPYEFRRGESVVLSAIPLSFAWLLGPFLAGLPLFLRRRPGGAEGELLRRSFRRLLASFLVVYALTVVAFFVTGRYRVPLLPFLAIGASATVVGAFERWRTGRRRPAALLAGSAVLLSLVLLPDTLGVRRDTRGWAGYMEAQDCLGRGDVEGAIEHFEAAHRSGTLLVARFYRAYAAALRRAGRSERGLEVAAEGLARHPRDVPLLLFAAEEELRAGRPREALGHAEAVLALGSGKRLEALFVSALAEDSLGDRAGAERRLAEARALAPGHPLTAQLTALLGGR